MSQPPAISYHAGISLSNFDLDINTRSSSRPLKFVNLQPPTVCCSIQSLEVSDRLEFKSALAEEGQSPLLSIMRSSIHHQVALHLRYQPSKHSSPSQSLLLPTINRSLFSQKPDRPASDLPSKPSFPAASFKDLGASRTVKVVVIVCLWIIGTMESITWGRLLWAKFSPSVEEGKEEGK